VLRWRISIASRRAGRMSVAATRMTMAAMSGPARRRDSRNTIVRSSGVSMPANVVPGRTPERAPTMSPKYNPAYGLATDVKNPRSIAYLTSREVTSRSTGGEKRIPALSRTVTLRPSADTSGSAAARSGSARVGSPGR